MSKTETPESQKAQPLTLDQEQKQKSSGNQKSQPEKQTAAPDTSSDAVEPDWDRITTPEEMAAELEAEEQAKAELVEDAHAAAVRDKFDRVAKKGMHLILGAGQKGAQFGLKVKTGYKFPELDLEAHEPALTIAAESAYELLDIDPEGWFGKFLHFAGNIDERYFPLLAYGNGLKEAVQAGMAEIHRLNAEAEKEQTDPIGKDTPKKGSVVPIEGKAPPAAPETKVSVVQP